MSEFFATLLNNVTVISATVETDVGTVVNHYGVVKGVGEVALTALSAADPPAAAIVTKGIALIDGWIKSGPDAVTANAPAIITTTQAILAAAAPVISAVTAAATSPPELT